MKHEVVRFHRLELEQKEFEIILLALNHLCPNDSVQDETVIQARILLDELRGYKIDR